jgi:signal peptide peptidase SppA
MDIKVLLQALGGVWFIEETAAYEYARYAELLKQGAEINIQSRSSLPYLADANGRMSMDGNVMVIPVMGAVMKYDFCGSPGTQTMIQNIKTANTVNQVQAIVLHIDSPGGAADGTEELAKAVAQSTKPVVAYANGNMASAAYFIGAAAREIIMSSESTMIGSIGTMATMRKNVTGDEQKVFFATKSTRKNRAYLSAMEGNGEEYINKVLDPLNEVFTSFVEKSRAGKIDLSKEDVTEGDIYIGKAALKAGLADKIGSFDYAIKRSLQLAKTIKP